MLRFTVVGSGRGTLQAVLLAPEKNGYAAHPLGALGTDSRGQSGMTVNVDPRNMSGRTLEDYDLILLLRTGDGEPELVMTGMMNGSKEVNWQKARAAAAAPFKKPRTPRPEAERETRSEMPDAATPEAALPQEALAPENPEICEDDTTQPTDEVPEAKLDAPTPVPEDKDADRVPQMIEQSCDEEQACDEEIPEAMPPTAAELLNLDMTQAWPEEIESLRALFQTEAAFEPFLLDDFVFVEAPLPDEAGGDGVCAIGIRASDGKPASICYALPGPNSIEPPPGLEGYRYLGGWWYTVLEPVLDDPDALS